MAYCPCQQCYSYVGTELQFLGFTWIYAQGYITAKVGIEPSMSCAVVLTIFYKYAITLTLPSVPEGRFVVGLNRNL